METRLDVQRQSPRLRTTVPQLKAAERLAEFLRMRPHDNPLLVIDLATIADNYRAFRTHLPYARPFYAIKANDNPDVLKLLVNLGSCFDAASLPEIKMALRAGADPAQISFGNTIKKERDIAKAHRLGIRIFVVDSMPEMEKIARSAPGASVYCRIAFSGEGAKWPLSRKFGCTPDMARDILRRAHALGLHAWGISFHVGSQQQNPLAWDSAIATAAHIFAQLKTEGITLSLLNMGGGFPVGYDDTAPHLSEIATHITDSLIASFGENLPEIIIEPGRAMVANAGVIRAEVVLISQKSAADPTRWVYLDIGLFSGLNEAGGEVLRYPIITPHDGTPASPAILAGPTCDSADILYERNKIMLPDALNIGDHILIPYTGAYTSSYSTAGFNGFAPLSVQCLQI